jgi:FkbM family methyltransferase
MQTFLQRFARTPLGDVFADNSPVSAFDPSLDWLDLPPKPFLDYVRSAQRTPYDGVPSDPAAYRDNTTFLCAQAHRIWLTVKQLELHLADSPSFVMLDLGAYPFAIDQAVRGFLHRRCRILATVAQRLSAESIACLAADQVELLPVNLDPRVKVEDPLPGMTDYLPLAGNSVDLVLLAHVIEHLYHPIQILREAVRVLRPGGKLLLTTDHGMLIGGLLNYLNNGAYLHEPVQSTAAMVFSEWRGHVRFYTEGDLRALLEAAGAGVVDCQLREVLYHSVPEEFFVAPNTSLPRWRVNLLQEFPPLRNEVLIVAQKGGTVENRVSNPFDRAANSAELECLDQQYAAGTCDLARATLLDFMFGSRLLHGRWPTRTELAGYARNPPARGLDELVHNLLSSREFQARALGVQLERPGPGCIIMTETEGGLRFFFSAQDTFVGFPVAVGVFEPDVRAALDRLVRPGMNCLDVGANLGYYSVRLAAVVRQAGGKVFSFEPDPFSYSLLLRNRAENRMEDAIVPFNVACGDEDSEVDLYPDPNPSNFGGTRVEKPGSETVSEQPGGTIPLRRIDDLVPPDMPVHLVKMDIEGFEPFALLGMRRILSAHRPALVCEFAAARLRLHGEDTPARFLNDLAALGYTVYQAEAFGRGELAPFQYQEAACQFVNLVCLP